MAKICFPNSCCAWFNSLKEARDELKNTEGGWGTQTLIDIIEYNICYRDYWRENGLKALLQRLSKELDDSGILSLIDDPIFTAYLRNRDCLKIADFDIQCYHINDQFSVLGHKFNGLKDVYDHMSIYALELDDFRYRSPLLSRCSTTENKIYSDISIGMLARSYFDNANKSQQFQNFIFGSHPVTEDDMRRAHSMNGLYFSSIFRGVHERSFVRPMLYHNTKSEYMLLATDKL